ncbi:hypothetical protein MNBD_GAMMA23-620 [hydrothermal vent metagenome]|uniref:HDOD domain-containing protein n=1 Tax=hydrothermal vent metagenome TaxID=652676 RepID=A0A3B1A860_9ZZZZ
MIDIKYLLKFDDFKDLDDATLVYISENAEVTHYQVNDRIIAEKESKNTLYLVHGAFDIQTSGGVNQSMSAESERAQHPVFTNNSPGLYARCILPTEIIRIGKDIIDKYGIRHNRDKDNLDYDNLETVVAGNTNVKLIHEITQLFKSNAITLPSLPEIALYINSELNNENLGTKKLAQVIQMDPVIAARIVQVANSALYGGSNSSDSIQNAISKIGLESIRNIVMGVVLRDLFMPNTELVVHKMTQFYESSIRTGVICYELAKQIPEFNPERAFLFGLLHDIGVIPILVAVDAHPELAHKESNLDTVLTQLKSHIGGMILQQWQFDNELIDNAREAYSWDRKVDKADYCDLVQVALKHSHLLGGEKVEGPELFDLPAFKRLGLEELNLIENITALKDISIRITDLIKMICKA